MARYSYKISCEYSSCIVISLGGSQMDSYMNKTSDIIKLLGVGMAQSVKRRAMG
jgi:hypothetical protein